MANISFTMIKPDAFSKGYAGLIINDIIQNGFKIKALKLKKLSLQEAEQFYAIHTERPFFKELTTFMSSGPIIAAIVEKQDAVADFRKLIGATNPTQAEEGTIRKKYASSIGENAIHGSDSDENAQIEANFFFGGFERV